MNFQKSVTFIKKNNLNKNGTDLYNNSDINCLFGMRISNRFIHIHKQVKLLWFYTHELYFRDKNRTGIRMLRLLERSHDERHMGAEFYISN